jgi:hypothetical protein
MLTPRSMRSRASRENFTSLAAIIVLLGFAPEIQLMVRVERLISR